MEDHDEQEASRRAAAVRRGSIVAAAGCGKTEQIARALEHTNGRRLILTHTHAGVEALRRRLKEKKVPEYKFAVETIAGWSLWFAASFPFRSGLAITEPEDGDWETVYDCAATLIRNGAISRVLRASYSGLFVDEYQDCTGEQHEIITAIANHIPACVFGDPLQAIFGFKGQNPVSWEKEVFPLFPLERKLTTPWRWKKAENLDLADWLEVKRKQLENGQAIDLNDRPSCVLWIQVSAPTKDGVAQGIRQKEIDSACRNIEVNNGQRLIVIGDGKNEGSRAHLAKRLSDMYFSNIEPVSCKALKKHSHTISQATGIDRLLAVLEFLQATMKGIPKSELKKSVESHLSGQKRGAKKFGPILPYCFEVVDSENYSAILGLAEHFREDVETTLYRSEMYFAMRAAIRLLIAGSHENFKDAIWEVQNKLRHAGRRLRKRNIGSTLLVKGLEFDHAVIIDADKMSTNDLYVALTRASTSLTILSPTPVLNTGN
jgi:DNA helicase-2/ATP-dependent DNA helicase PcrA